MNIRSVSNITGVPKSTVAVLRKNWEQGNEQNVSKMVSILTNKGRKTVLTFEEEEMIVQRIKVAATRGFAIDYDGIRAIMSRIAADGRQGWKRGIPSYDTVRAFRARHREITCRKSESKDHAKLSAENYEHVETFFAALESVDKLHPGMLQKSNCVWNMDETAISAIEGDKEKVFSASESHHGGFRGASTSYGISKHVTAVIAVSASGHIAPPFFIVAGKKISSRSLEPIRGKLHSNVSGICSRFTQPNWFPTEGVIKMTDNGSMEIPIMNAFVVHLNNFVREVCSETYVLCLDGHSSRKGVEWIEECVKNRCEAVVSPANTSHFLQPCDQTVNRRFKAAIRELRDEFCKLGTVDTRQVGFNLACGVYAFEQISAKDVVNSFKVTGVFPFDREFPLQYLSEKQKTEGKVEESLERVKSSGPGSRLKSVLLRRSDKETLGEVQEVLKTNMAACRQLQQLSIILKNAETTNNILMEAGSGRSSECSTAHSTNAPRSVLFDAGAPAEWVTVGQVIERRKKKDAKLLKLQMEKEADRLRKERERIERGELEKKAQQKKEAEKERKKLEKVSARLLEAAAKKRRVAKKRFDAKKGREIAKNMKEDAAWLGNKGLELWKLQNPGAMRRGRKRDARGNEKVVPYVRSFQFISYLVTEALWNAMGGIMDESGVQN